MAQIANPDPCQVREVVDAGGDLPDLREGSMDDYDRKAWEALERERQRQLARSPRRLVPSPVRERASEVARRAHERASSVPGFDQAEDLVEEVLSAAGDVGAKLAADSVWQSRITSAYSKAGHPVELITDIQQLALRDIDKIRPSFGVRYMAAGLDPVGVVS